MGIRPIIIIIINLKGGFMEEGKVDKIWDNSESPDKPNFSIDLIDGKRLYARETVNANIGDTISYTAINTKTSKNGNHYTNVSGVKVFVKGAISQVNGDTHMPQSNTSVGDKSQQARQDIFVTGIVGRSMGGGRFSVDDIGKLTQNAVKAFNEFLAK
jgi:hypothetical protein